jgi:hypothetical protein
MLYLTFGAGRHYFKNRVASQGSNMDIYPAIPGWAHTFKAGPVTPELLPSLRTKHSGVHYFSVIAAGLSGSWHGVEAEDVPQSEDRCVSAYSTYARTRDRKRVVRIAFSPHATSRATNIDQELKNCLDLELTEDYRTARLYYWSPSTSFIV